MAAAVGMTAKYRATKRVEAVQASTLIFNSQSLE
jgi:hypothetical protein